LISHALVADFKILAEIALQIAMGKENGSGPVSAHQRGFFAKMGVVSVNKSPIRCPANPFLARFPVNPAFSGAKRARLKD